MKKIIFILLTLFLVASQKAYAADVTVHVSILGSTQTVFYDNVTVAGNGCTITDSSNAPHTYTSPLTICALDKAAQLGGFSYDIQSSGFITKIAGETGTGSQYWGYDASRNLANLGATDSTAILQNGDWIYFHLSAYPDDSVLDSQNAIFYGLAYVQSQQGSDGKTSGYDSSTSQFDGASSWAAMAFVGANKTNTALTTYMQAHAPTLSDKATDWEKRILAITSLGENPYTFGGTNYIANLESYYTSNQIGDTSSLNDDFFGLLALLSSKVDITTPIMTDTLSFITSHQLTDGCFSYSTTTTTGDTDDTAAAFMALQAAKSQGMTVAQNVLDNAKTCILAHLNSDGGFYSDATYGTTSNTSSTTWAVMALKSIGVNDSSINNAQAYIRKNQFLEDGSFNWQLPNPGATGDTATTSYAILALNGKFWPLNIFSGTVPSVTPAATPTPTVTPTPTQSTQSPTDTPTPTPTPVVITNTNTVYVYPTAAPTNQTPQITYVTNTILATPTPTPTPLPGVLGLTTTNTQTPQQQSQLPTFFTGMGSAFLAFYFWSLLQQLGLLGRIKGLIKLD